MRHSRKNRQRQTKRRRGGSAATALRTAAKSFAKNNAVKNILSDTAEEFAKGELNKAIFRKPNSFDQRLQRKTLFSEQVPAADIIRQKYDISNKENMENVLLPSQRLSLWNNSSSLRNRRRRRARTRSRRRT